MLSLWTPLVMVGLMAAATSDVCWNELVQFDSDLDVQCVDVEAWPHFRNMLKWFAAFQ